MDIALNAYRLYELRYGVKCHTKKNNMIGISPHLKVPNLTDKCLKRKITPDVPATLIHRAAIAHQKIKMMSDLQVTRYSLLTDNEKAELQTRIFEESGQVVNVGDIIVRDYGIKKVLDVFIKDGEVAVRLDDTYEGYGTSLKELFGDGRNSVYSGTWEELEKEAKEYFLTGKIDGMEDISDEESQADGLVQIKKGDYLQYKQGLILKANAITARMNALKILSETKLREIREWSESVRKELKRVNKVLWTLELYLGINEDIVMIRDGQPEPDESPIHLMQEMLFMDEEVGDPTDGGLDIRSIEVFDQWLLRHNTYYGYTNFNLIVPYDKCVRILRVRRHKKDYGDPWEQMIMDRENFKTYILIRNGEQLYKIHADMSFGPKLFPDQNEIMNVLNTTDVFKQRKAKESALDLIDIYRRNFLVIQGLIDRTEVFGKLEGLVNVIDNSALEKGQIILHYDGDHSTILSDGGMDFYAVLKEAQKSIEVGTRIYLKGYQRSGDNQWSRRFPNSRWNQNNFPNGPSGDIYSIEEINRKGYGGEYYIKYLPNEERWVNDWRNGWELKKRSKQVTFALYSDEIINYDYFTHRDILWIEKMLHDRRERKNYTNYMAALTQIWKIKKAENLLELEFARNIVQREIPQANDLEILDAIDWWKRKVKFKRSLKDDEAKAMRMIISKLKKKL